MRHVFRSASTARLAPCEARLAGVAPNKITSR